MNYVHARKRWWKLSHVWCVLVLSVFLLPYTTLSCTCGDVSDLEKGLTNDVERVAKWVEANKLRLNVTKTNLLLMSRKRRAQELQQVNVAVNIQELVRCKKVKCLGVVLDDGLMWKEQVVNVRRKCFAGLANCEGIGIYYLQTVRGKFIMQSFYYILLKI